MADIQSAEEAAKVKELEATLDFLKVKKTESSETVNAERSEAKGDPGTDKNKDNKAEGGLKDHSVVSGMSELDRARASRFAPPKHVLEQVAEHNTAGPVEEKADNNKPKPAQPIKNPLPIPKKHEAKDMDFDHDIPSLDMHFDVVDMSGMDFFDIN